MPPWFVEKDIGIQRFKDDPSLSDEEIAKIAKWADSGAPRGNPADMPPPRHFEDGNDWVIGKPDLVLRSPDVVVPAAGPDKWGSLGLVPTGLIEDRYVSALEVREVSDIPVGGPAKTVGARYAFHHMSYTSVVPGERDQSGGAEEGAWPVHEVGRNPDIFPPEAGRLLPANSALSLNNYHLHSNGRETRAHLEFGFKFFPKGYKPLYRRSTMRLGNGIDMDVRPNQANRVRAAHARTRDTYVPRGDLGPQHPDAQLRGLRPQLGQTVRVCGRCRAAPAEGHHRSHHRLPGHHVRKPQSR
jgi:hypothetical protein